MPNGGSVVQVPFSAQLELQIKFVDSVVTISDIDDPEPTLIRGRNVYAFASRRKDRLTKTSWAALHQTVSGSFTHQMTPKIAVAVIDVNGDNAIKVFEA